MRIITLLLFVILLTSASSAQDDSSINLMITEDSWRKEAFKFPKPFAPAVDFDGVADVRFTDGWSTADSPKFWSYAFAWKLNLEKGLSDSQIEHYLELYFDGLMQVVNRDTSIHVPSTTALFISKSTAEAEVSYKGKIRLYDAFFSTEMITLKVNGEYHYCTDHDNHVYLFRLSPKDLDNEVWNHLNKAALQENICTY